MVTFATNTCSTFSRPDHSTMLHIADQRQRQVSGQKHIQTHSASHTYMQEACLPLCINVKLRCRDQPNPQPTTLQFIYPCPASYNLFDLGYFLELKIIELFDHFEYHHSPIFLSSLQRDGHDILWCQGTTPQVRAAKSAVMLTH